MKDRVSEQTHIPFPFRAVRRDGVIVAVGTFENCKYAVEHNHKYQPSDLEIVPFRR